MQATTAHRGSVALLLAVLAATTAVGAFLRVAGLPRAGDDLKPRPDALEYGVAARSLVERGSYTLPIGDVDYPPRYPPGFPLLAAPFVALRGGDPAGARDAALCFGVLSILLVGLLGRRAAGTAGAAGAALVVACSAGAIRSSGLAMSETATLALGALALLGVAIVVSRPRADRDGTGWLVAAGVAVALAFSIRYTNLAVVGPALLFLGLPHAFAPARRVRALLAFGLPVAAGVIAELVRHRATFSAWTRDGYHFWVPEVYDRPGLLFSVRYAAKGIEGYWEKGNLEAYLDVLRGADDELYVPIVAVLVVVGFARSLLRLRSCPVARWLVVAATLVLPALFGFYLVYFWQSPRFLLAALPLLAVFAGAGVEGLRELASKVSRGAGVAVAGLALAALAVAIGRPAFDRALERPDPSPPPPLTAVLPSLAADLPPDAVVIVNFPVTLAAPALGPDRELVVTNRHDADPHLERIHAHGLVGAGGRTSSVRSLAIGDAPDQDGIEFVLRALRDGRPVRYVHAIREAPGGRGIEELAKRATFGEPRARPPFTVVEVRLP